MLPRSPRTVPDGSVLRLLSCYFLYPYLDCGGAGPVAGAHVTFLFNDHSPRSILYTDTEPWPGRG